MRAVALALAAVPLLVAPSARAEDPEGPGRPAALEITYDASPIALTSPKSTRLSTIYPFAAPARTVPGAVSTWGFQLGDGFRLWVKHSLVIPVLSIDLGYSPQRVARTLGDGATYTTHAGWWLRFGLPGFAMRLPTQDWQITLGARTALTLLGAFGDVSGPRGRYDARAWTQMFDVEGDIEICTPKRETGFTGCAFALPAVNLSSGSPGAAFGVRGRLIPW